jgi:hypothetical protein
MTKITDPDPHQNVIDPQHCLVGVAFSAWICHALLSLTWIDFASPWIESDLMECCIGVDIALMLGCWGIRRKPVSLFNSLAWIDFYFTLDRIGFYGMLHWFFCIAWMLGVSCKEVVSIVCRCCVVVTGFRIRIRIRMDPH